MESYTEQFAVVICNSPIIELTMTTCWSGFAEMQAKTDIVKK